MKILLRPLLIAVIVLLTGLGASALDLPVQTVRGKDYYIYKVEKNESVYAISKRLGISREDIVRHNPQAADGVTKKMVLMFPCDEYTTPVEEEVVVEVDTVVAEPVVEVRPSIAVVLPFGLNAAEPSRRNKMSLDFYKGFLLGVDTLAARCRPLDIKVYDSEDPAFDPAIAAEASVTVAPDSETIIAALAEAAAPKGNYVLNTLVVADSLYLTNSAVVQANIPQRMMYNLAVDAFEQEYEGYTPVILRSTSGRNDKEAFTTYLLDRLQQKGIEAIVLEYQNSLLAAELEEKLPAGRHYVVVPSSGSLSEFNKFCYVLKSYRERLAATAAEALADDPESTPTSSLRVFGYPDWTAFRGDALEMLGRLEATVYSRFFDNFDSFNTNSLEQAFRARYGTPIIESVPSQALLGYDTACYLLRNIMLNGSYNPLDPPQFLGEQSVFSFEKIAAGYCNASLFIITYRSDGRIAARTI